MRARDASVTPPACASAKIRFKREIDGGKARIMLTPTKENPFFFFLYTQFNYPPPRQGARLFQDIFHVWNCSWLDCKSNSKKRLSSLSDFSSWSNVDSSSGCRRDGSVPGQLHAKGYLAMRKATESTLTLIGFYSSLPSSNRDSLPRGISDWSHTAAPTRFPPCSGLIFSPAGPAPSWIGLEKEAVFFFFLRLCLQIKDTR